MKKLFIFLLFISISVITAQEKYFIYFKDKSILPTEQLSKSSPSYLLALDQLSQKSTERRIKNMGEENIITYEDLPIRYDYISQIENLGIKIDNKLKWFNAITAYLSEEKKNQVENLAFVDKVERVKKFVYKDLELISPSGYIEKPSSIFPIDYGQSFAQLQLSDVPAVHTKGITGEGVLLGLLDTGFNWKNHESLENTNVVAEYDFIFNDNSTQNDLLDVPSQHNHGTLVFSIVGGFKDSVLIGSAFGSDFILAKTEDIRSEKHVEEDNYAAALEWMENYGVDITSSSLGYSTFDPPEFSYTYADMDGKTTIVTRAAELAFRRGVVTITSAGNEGGGIWHYITAPADGFNTLGIGAVNNDNQVASFSSRGPSYDGRVKPDMVTQGVSVYGASANNYSGYTLAGGTSVAAPIASGIAALLLSAHSHLKNSQIRNILIETADNVSSPNFDRGYGLISATRAIEFPNLEETVGTFTVNKIFLSNENINPQSVTLHYSTDEINYDEAQMDFDGSLRYTYQFPFLFNDDLVRFYITYEDNNSNSFRDPQNNYYSFYYGSLDIGLNLEPDQTYSDYAVSEPFPNPFYPEIYSFTSVSIKSNGNEKLNIRIIDPLGQQVLLYNSITTDGLNRFDWLGEQDNGLPVASGVYYLLIDLDGKKHSRNLVLLR